MRIGVDIGGSHVGVGLVDSDGNIVKRHESYVKEKKTDTMRNFIIDSIISVLTDWKENDNIEINEIGIGAPGVIRNNEIVSSVNLGLENFKIGEEINKYFPSAKVKVMNDAKCAALAEKKLGSLKNYDDCLFMCLGTGIGGAAFFDGKLVEPKRCAGFEVGHMIIVKDGKECKCGSKGCYERYASMRHFKRDIREKLNLDEFIDGGELRDVIRANITNEKVQKSIDEYVKYICVGLTNLVNILEPQIICLGGGFVKYEDILFDKLKETFKNSKDIFYKEDIPEIVMAKYGNDAGMIGSALAFE